MRNSPSSIPANTAAAAKLVSSDSSFTPFQRQVYSSLCLVPPGSVTTYQNLAQAINCRSNQAVGQALRRNPWGPHVPCHRVVRTDGTIGGFNGTTSGNKIHRKLQLLIDEGVQFLGDGRVDPQCIYSFPDKVDKSK